MNSKQRVFMALAHEIPDRVPIALWGGSYGIVDPLYERLVDLLGLGSPLPPIREGHTVNHMDDRVLSALDIDVRFIWPGAAPSDPRHISKDDDLIYDDFGQPWKRTHPYYSATDGILKDADSLEEIETLVKWPDVDDPYWTQGVALRADELQEDNHFIIGRMVVSHGPYQMACDLRNMENFMMDMILEPDFAKALLNRVTDVICGLTRNYLRIAGDRMDMIELPGDDYAANDNLIFSPELFRELIKPQLQRIIRTVKSTHPDLKIMFHSDGAIGELMPEFIDLDIDVIHPLEPVAGMNPAQIKADFGDKICFLGGVDISHAMNGSIEDVRGDVERCLHDIAAGGGYILAPCNHLQADVTPENLVELYRYTKERGKYRGAQVL